MKNLLLIVGIAIVATAAQLLLKRTMTQLGPLELRATIPFLLRAFASGPFWISLLLYVTGFLGYLFLMTRLDLSYLYPVTISLGFILITTLSCVFLGEQLSVARILGLILLVGGTVLVGVTAG